MPNILDASAVLALLRNERGAAQVQASLPGAVMSAVNAAEVVRVLVHAGVAPADAKRALARLHLPVTVFGEQDLAAVAEITGLAPGLSLGDCACLALAKRTGIEALTADRAWTRVNIGVPVRLIR